jgi:2,3-bisphosphoglycerate-independent phosphoglycerate mutase
MKYCIVIMDGASGWPLDELGGLTTLAAADTPNLDALAQEGMCGLARTVPPGTEPSSAAACMAILGYDPIANHIGRGAIEAASMGISLAPDEVALRMNLVNVTAGVMTSYACGHITTPESHAIVADLAAALTDETFTFHPGVAYRHILVVKGHPELMDLEYTPPHDISDKPVDGKLPSGPGAELLLDLMQRAKGVLAASPANRERSARGGLPATSIWPFWPGVTPKDVRSLEELHGVRVAMTSGVDLLNGLAVLMGIDRLDIPGVTDGADNDYAGQTEGGLAALSDHDLVVIHVESPDEEGHAGDAARKIAAIEAIDREVISRVRAHSGEMRILVMPDHPTPILIKTHVAEAVPFVLAGPGVASTGVLRFDESWATQTRMMIDPGYGIMGLLLAR